MSEIPTGDGFWAVHPSTGELALAVPTNQFDASVLDAIKSQSPDRMSDLNIETLGRSAPAIAAGVEVVEDAGGVCIDAYEGQEYVYGPAAMYAVHPVGERIITRIGEIAATAQANEILKLKGEKVPGGRYLPLDDYVECDEEEVAWADRNNYIGFAQIAPDIPSHRQQGNRLLVPLASHMLVPVTEVLLQNDQWFEMYLHGRRVIDPRIVAFNKNPEEPVKVPFFVGTMLFAPGQYSCQIDEIVTPDGKIKHLRGATTIDAHRTMGLSERLGRKRRGQQGEFINLASKLPWNEIWPSIRLLRPNPATERGQQAIYSPPVNWREMSPGDRRKLHHQGFNIGEVIEPVLNELGALVQLPHGGAVVTQNGISLIKDASTLVEGANPTAQELAEYNFVQLQEAIKSAGHSRTLPPELRHFRPLTQKMGLIANNPRLALARDLPAEYMKRAFDEGDLQGMVVWQDGEIVTEGSLHSALTELTRAGKLVAWVNDGQFLVLHKSGYRGTPESINRIADLDIVFSSFGTNVDHVGEANRQNTRGFYQKLKAAGIDMTKVGTAHGNGPGQMRIGHEETQEVGGLSIGSGMDFTKMGQARPRSQKADIESLLAHLDRLPRQGMLDDMVDIANFWIGGSGTIGEELGIRLTSTKLKNMLPMPMILIENTGLYSHIIEQIHELADRDDILVGDQKVDLTKKRLLDKWVPYFVASAANGEEAADIALDFWQDPAKHWKKAGVPVNDIILAFAHHVERNERTGRKMAGTLVQAAERYTSLSHEEILAAAERL